MSSGMQRRNDTAIKNRLRRQLDQLGAQLKLTMCSDILQKSVHTQSSVKNGATNKCLNHTSSELMNRVERGRQTPVKRQAKLRDLTVTAEVQQFGSLSHILPTGRITQQHVSTHLQECDEEGREDKKKRTFLLLQRRGRLSFGHKPQQITCVWRQTNESAA